MVAGKVYSQNKGPLTSKETKNDTASKLKTCFI